TYVCADNPMARGVRHGKADPNGTKTAYPQAGRLANGSTPSIEAVHTFLEIRSMSRSTVLAFLALMLTAGFAAEARASFMITTPTGLNPGDQFFVIFATSTTTTATSTVIG